MTFALFGIENDGLNLAVNLLVFFLVVIWLALVYWTYADAQPAARRPDAGRLRDGRVAVPVHRDDRLHDRAPAGVPRGRHERELEIKAAEKRLALLENRTCRNCGGEVEPSFLRCPSCMRKLKEPCRSCGKPLDPRWRVCPYCEAEVAGVRAGAPSGRAAPARRPRGGARAERAGGAHATPGAERADAPASATADRDARATRDRRADARPRAGRGPRRADVAAAARTDSSRADGRTLILVKPDAFERGLTGEVIARFERKGLRIAALKLMQVDRELAEQHYGEHSSKPFFGELVEFITRGPLVAMVLEGEEAVAGRAPVIGATNPLEAAPGSIRGDFALEVTFNLVHGSDSDETAEREIGAVLPGALTAAGSRSRLVLASRSPQRRAILEQLGIPFEVSARPTSRS